VCLVENGTQGSILREDWKEGGDQGTLDSIAISAVVETLEGFLGMELRLENEITCF
jgi:hypothetical protein